MYIRALFSGCYGWLYMAVCVCVCVCVCGVTNFSTVVAGFIRPINTVLQEQYSILCNTCKCSIMVCVCVFQLWLVSKSYKSLAIYIKAAVIRVWWVMYMCVCVWERERECVCVCVHGIELFVPVQKQWKLLLCWFRCDVYIQHLLKGEVKYIVFLQSEGDVCIINIHLCTGHLPSHLAYYCYTCADHLPSHVTWWTPSTKTTWSKAPVSTLTPDRQGQVLKLSPHPLCFVLKAVESGWH